MKKIVILCLALTGCTQEICTKWEYANLNLSSATIVENDEVKELNFTAIWVSDKASEQWYDFKPITKTNNKELADYFNAKSNHPISILNALGELNWEIYDYESHNPNEITQVKEWQLKRCLR